MKQYRFFGFTFNLLFYSIGHLLRAIEEMPYIDRNLYHFTVFTEISMGLKIYNTLTREKVDFKPINPPYVGMYVCGPTVYGNSHLGHARSYTIFDVIYRYLKFSGYKVRYVQNITDVGHLAGNADEGDDKIAKQASLEKLEPVEIAYKYELSYFEDMKKLNILYPDISCRATGHIIEMIEHINALIDKGFAYKTDDGNVYFDVRKFPDYGKLSGRNIEDTKEGERIEIASDKRNPQDFALWKAADDQHIMKWNSPWGEGYPGWHIECSVMSRKYIGDTLDIHGGGMDNIFPHHECEIAQSESLTGKPFVNYFIHNNMLTVNGTKMGKSLGNFIVLKDLYKETDPMVLRFYILQCHYRSVLDFTKESLSAAKTGYERLKNSIFTLRKKVNGLNTSKTFEEADKIFEDFTKAMDDDFNTPIAISVVYDMLKLSNTELSSSTPDMDKLSYISTFVDKMTDILGFNIGESSKAGHEDQLIEFLIEIRNSYRKDKNFAMSDTIRDTLKKMGIVLKDSAQTSTYTIE